MSVRRGFTSWRSREDFSSFQEAAVWLKTGEAKRLREKLEANASSAQAKAESLTRAVTLTGLAEQASQQAESPVRTVTPSRRRPDTPASERRRQQRERDRALLYQRDDWQLFIVARRFRRKRGASPQRWSRSFCASWWTTPTTRVPK